MKRLIDFGLVCLLLCAANGHASPLLTGDVSFDDTTQLYTYTYNLDTSNLLDNTVEVGLLDNLGFSFTNPLPAAHTEPDDWGFVIALGGLRASGPDNIAGSFWMWVNTSFNNDNITNNRLTFSVTTDRGINTTSENNYFIFNGGQTSGPIEAPGFIEIGHIVGPELDTIDTIPDPDPGPGPVTTVPENDTYALMIAGFAIIGLVSKRKMTKQDFA